MKLWKQYFKQHAIKWVRASAKTLADACNAAIRAIRRDCMDKLQKMQKNGEITEDDLKYGEKEMQDITDKFVKETDSVAAEKEKEIMAI